MDTLYAHTQSPYSDQWDTLLQHRDKDPHLRAVLQEMFARMKGGVVVDVGVGQSDKMAKLFTQMNTTYIGVDPIPRRSKSQIAGAAFVEDDIVSFLQDRVRYQQFRKYPSRNFMLNGIDSIATSVSFDELADMLIFYLNPGDYVFGIYAPEMVRALRKHSDVYEEVYCQESEGNRFFAFRLRQPMRHSTPSQ